MEEIKVGEYIRDKEGHITKIINTLSLFKDVYLYLGEDGYQYNDNAILKHSPNIIELLEVGDILEILCNEISKETNTIRIKDIEQLKVIKQIPKFIKSVMTKEQFKNVSYEV